jgi:hypothetical protein
LPEIRFEGAANPVVQVVAEDTGNVLYTIRALGDRFQPHVFAPGSYTVRMGRDRPDGPALVGLQAETRKPSLFHTVKLSGSGVFFCQ